jgi:hypothetical protein
VYDSANRFRLNLVVDFLCPEQRLIIEIDGGQHALATNADDARTAWLEARGFRVVRFWNKEVLKNLDPVDFGGAEGRAVTPTLTRPHQRGREFM